jgi:peroxiredoxin
MLLGGADGAGTLAIGEASRGVPGAERCGSVDSRSCEQHVSGRFKVLRRRKEKRKDQDMRHTRRNVLGIAFGLGSVLLGAATVPRSANDFTAVEPSGKHVSLSGYAGKVVLVLFLHTTCPHCQATARLYGKLQTEFGPLGLQVVGVAFNVEAQGHPEVVRSFVESNGVGFPLGVAPMDSVLSYLGISVMSRFAVPQGVVIDRNGIIRFQSDLMGSDELQDESRLRPLLEGLLKEGNAGGAAPRKPAKK